MARAEIQDFIDQHVESAIIENTLDDEFIEEDESGDAIIDVLSLHVPDLITLTARLAQLLAEEADLLEQMKIQDISDLQKEKITLIAALEAQHRQIRKQPDLLDDISISEREQLQRVVDLFNMIRDENYHRLQTARAVNHKIVQAIAEVVSEANCNGQYDDKGSPDKPAYSALSVTLNKRI